MLKAVLFDLDDTLLANDMAVFLPPYLETLSGYARPLVDPKRFVHALHQGTQAMMQGQDGLRTNREVFWERFCALTELEHSQAETFLAGYYVEQFGKLSGLTQPVSGAAELVEACYAHGLQLVLATNPIFPQAAIEQRLAWTGIPRSRFNLVTSYETMRSAKPAPRYFREIVDALGCSPHEALMVGNDPEQDIAPAQAAGLHVMWTTNGSRAASKPWPAAANGGREPRALTEVWSHVQALTSA
jgi:FMN phosphatase YigB (HAD superfamily)